MQHAQQSKQNYCQSEGDVFTDYTLTSWQVPLPKPASWDSDQRKKDGCANDLLLFGSSLKNMAARKPRESVPASSKDSRCHHSVFLAFVYSLVCCVVLQPMSSCE